MSAVDHEAAVARLLADLGDTADAVADRLRALGIKGEQEDSCACPVARYILGEGYGWASAGPSTTSARVGDGHVTISNPQPIRGFIRRFDAGVYLDLVEVAS